MPQPYDYSTVQVNPDNYFESVRQGRAEQAQQEAATRQSALQKYMPGALQGDAAARAQVMANADPEQQIALQNRFDNEGVQKIEQAMKMNGAINQLLSQVRDGDQQGFEAAKARAAQIGIPMDQMGHLTIADLPRLRAESGQTARELDIQYKQAQIAAQKANAAQSYAAADASRRSGQGGGGNWSDPGGDGDGLNPYDGISDPKQRDMMYRQLTADFNARQRDYQKDRIEAQNILAATDEFLALNKKVGSGGVTGSGGISSMPIVNSARNMVDSDWARMNAITDKLTPLMRQGLPGAASDRDMQTFRGATVGTGKLGEANVGIARGLQVAAKNAIDKGLFDEAYFRRNKHLQGSDNAWNRYLEENPIFDPNSDPANPALNRSRKSWREYVAPSPQATPKGAPPPPPPASNNPPLVRSKSEFDALPRGTVYRESDGKVYRKP